MPVPIAQQAEVAFEGREGEVEEPGLVWRGEDGVRDPVHLNLSPCGPG